jgi:hypothetical protein
MELNGYTLAIKPGKERNCYIEMKHNTQYSVFLFNDNETRCDAKLSIDGVVVGTWRIEAEGAIRLDRGVDETGRFTFYKLGSREGELAQLIKNETLGLVQCVFSPEDVENYYEDNLRGGQIYNPPLNAKSVTRGGGDSLSAGGTGLSGHSNQNFGKAKPIQHYNDQKTTTIYLRLVCKDVPEVVENIRPLRRSSTDIPRPLI